MRRIQLSVAVFLAAASGLCAQGRDPMHEIQEIARSVEQQLQEIDRLLLESGKANQARAQPTQMLDQARERGQAVQDGIDKLIEKLNEMKNQGGGGSPSEEEQSQQPKDGQGQGQGQPQQGQPQNRRENGTPDFVQQPQQQDQPQPQPGGTEPQPAQPQQGQPQGGQDAQTAAENRPGNRPPESATGPGQNPQGEEGWGELQPYVNFLKNRGSSPKVPERYRKYWEAYLKQKQGSGK